MSDERTLILEGVSRIQLLELQNEFGSGVIQTAQDMPTLSFGTLSDEAVIFLILTLPIAKAIAQMIVRDKITFICRSRRPDGTEEEISLKITHPVHSAEARDEIVKRLMGEIESPEDRPLT